MTSWILLGLLLVAALAFALVYYRISASMQRLDQMLNEAIRGEFATERYDESQLSKIEAKMSQFLNASKLRRGQIEREQERIRALISDISHQTKTPISNIMLYAQLLEEQEGLSEEAKLCGDQISAGAKKLHFLIEALVKTSRLESGVIQVRPKQGDVGELIHKVLGQCRKQAEEKSISLCYTEPNTPVYALFDSKWCAEALFNIVDNGVKYSEAGGEITVSVNRYEFFVRIDIQDKGRGIRAEELPLVFARFWRSPDSAQDEGVGVGLFLSREIIAACGGYIKLSSQLGAGALFSVFLPTA